MYHLTLCSVQMECSGVALYCLCHWSSSSGCW